MCTNMDIEFLDAYREQEDGKQGFRLRSTLRRMETYPPGLEESNQFWSCSECRFSR